MGIIVFIGFCLIALIVVCAIIGASGASDNTRNPHFCQNDQNPYLADSMEKADMELLMEDDDIRAEFGDEVEGDFYGGIPFGDGKIVMADDDFVEEFGDEVM